MESPQTVWTLFRKSKLYEIRSLDGPLHARHMLGKLNGDAGSGGQMSPWQIEVQKPDGVQLKPQKLNKFLAIRVIIIPAN
jgi:hypothetical protein